ncbi:MAG: DUF302 domain-containing protein [Gammaproteobacteria bacterium]|nr:DUF302 domain-containing protein [Gammaproteobacteria bacterium]
MRNVTSLQLLFISLLLLPVVSQAVVTDELIMIRSQQDFPTTMVNLQDAIKVQGYQVSRVQRVDVGLSKSGFKTDRYRLVFFGKGSEIEFLRKKYPSLIPYLPLKIVIFAEGEETLLVTLNPKQLMQMYSEPSLQPIFVRWQQDVINIMRVVRVAD